MRRHIMDGGKDEGRKKRRKEGGDKERNEWRKCGWKNRTEFLPLSFPPSMNEKGRMHVRKL